LKNPYLNQIQDHLWPQHEGSHIWAVLDGARDRRIFGALLNSYQNHSCLYAGALAPEIEVVAPYVVQLDYNDKLTKELLNEGWGNSWGIYLRADSTLDRIRRHLRTLLTVQDHSGKRLLFRYYDPRVLRVYLPTCVAEELRAVFGPIECFWMEDRAGTSLLEFKFDRNKLVQNSVPLASPQKVNA
jgi:hypothetical protein